MNRNTDRPRLLGDGAVNRLPNPPGGVCTEFEAAARVELADRPQKTHIAFLDQVEEGDAASQVTLGNADDEAQVGADQRLVGFHRADLGRVHFHQKILVFTKVLVKGSLIWKSLLVLVEMFEQPLRIRQREQVQAEKDTVGISCKVVPELVHTPV